MSTNTRAATIAARTADLRVMLDQGIDHFEGIDKDDALRELLDLLDEQANARAAGGTWAVLDSDGSVLDRFVDEDDMLEAQQDTAYEGKEFAFIADPCPEGDIGPLPHGWIFDQPAGWDGSEPLT